MKPSEPGPNDPQRRDRPRGRQRDDPPSWLDVLGVGGDTRTPAASQFDRDWGSGAESAADSRFVAGAGRRDDASQDGALARVYRTYAAARAAIGIGLVAVHAAGSVLGSHSSLLALALGIAYALQAVVLWLLPRPAALDSPALPAQRRRQWLATIGVDLLAFSALHLMAAGSSFNFAALLVLPVLMAGVLTRRLLALGTAAFVTLLLLLAGALRATLGGGELTALMLQAGLAGLGLFVIALLAGELAGRLVREELAARGSLQLARQQAQLNRLVIEEMADGVLVVDRRLRVRAANPAARGLLVDQGLGPAAPFVLGERPAWSALAQAVVRALAEDNWPEAGREVTLDFAGGHSRVLRMRVRFTRRRAVDADETSGESFAVLLLEDVRTAQARLRQEKLAAMGRVSAGIAHEIRNPLAAISQANALLLEDGLPPAQQRLARMVADNVERLRRIVDDVLEVAPGPTTPPQAIDATAELAAATAEWARTAELPLGVDGRLRIELPTAPLFVDFDPEHLRRVLVNLLDNARRHAGMASGAIFLRLAARDAGQAVLSVFSDCEPIAPEVERHLFEPFFSTRSRGSGLGLYICRELCERYGASIDYRPRPGAERLRNEFVVTLRRSARPAAEPALSSPPSMPRSL